MIWVAILIIAVFYTDSLSWIYLVMSAALFWPDVNAQQAQGGSDMGISCTGGHGFGLGCIMQAYIRPLQAYCLPLLSLSVMEEKTHHPLGCNICSTNL